MVFYKLLESSSGDCFNLIKNDCKSCQTTQTCGLRTHKMMVHAVVSFMASGDVLQLFGGSEAPGPESPISAALKTHLLPPQLRGRRTIRLSYLPYRSARRYRRLPPLLKGAEEKAEPPSVVIFTKHLLAFCFSLRLVAGSVWRCFTAVLRVSATFCSLANHMWRGNTWPARSQDRKWTPCFQLF